MHIHECKTCRRGWCLLMAGLIFSSDVCDRSRGLMAFLSASVLLLCSLPFSNMICHLLWPLRSLNRCHIWSNCSYKCLCTSASVFLWICFPVPVRQTGAVSEFYCRPCASRVGAILVFCCIEMQFARFARARTSVTRFANL